MKYSLRLLIPLLLLVFAAATSLIVYRFNYMTAIENTEYHGIDTLREHLIHFQINAEYYFRVKNTDRIQEELAYLVSQSAIKEVLLFDDSGLILASSRRAQIGRTLSEIYPPDLLRQYGFVGRLVENIRQTRVGHIFLTEDKQVVHGFYPVLLWDDVKNQPRPSRTGIVYAKYDLKPELIDAQRFVEFHVATFSGYATVMALMMWLLFHFYVARRTSLLLKAVNNFSNNVFEGGCGVSGRDELGRLGKAFDEMVINISESRRRLMVSEKRFNTAFNSNPDMVTISRLRDGVILDANDAFVRMSGYSRAEIIGRAITELGLLEKPAEQEDVIEQLRMYGTVHDRELVMTTRIGARRILSLSVDLIEIEFDPCVLSVARDITERKNIEAQLYEAKERAEVTLSSIADAVITTDARGVVEYLNPVAEQLTGWSQKDANGMPLGVVLKIANDVTREIIDEPVKKCLEQGIVTGLVNNSVLISRDGTEYPVEDSASPIRDRQGKIIGAVIVFHDVSSTRIMARQMSWQATHDPLTGLVNRREFENRLSRALISAQEEKQLHSLMYIDLDMFKLVNDTSGHVAGDELLKQVSVVMQSKLRDADTLARLGGDEFGVLLESCPPEKAKLIADNLLNAIRDFRFVWGGRTFEFGASIGLVHITEDDQSSSRLMSFADLTCYAAKEKGRNRVQIFEEGDEDIAQRHSEMEWVTRINEAIKHNRMALYRQSIVSVCGEDSSARHCEVLVRMLDENGELILPGAFLPAAERYNLMPTLDRWVFETLMSRMEQVLSDNLLGSQSVSRFLFNINLSGASLNDDNFLEFVQKKLQNSTIQPEMICFEITETAAISNLVKASRFIREVKNNLGCSFALDDFGSGVSSFAYLKNLPVDYLKINGGFVRDMLDDPIDRAMVEAINKIGHSMGIRTIAEFVENEAILEELRKLGVDYAQGYGIDSPRPLKFGF